MKANAPSIPSGDSVGSGATRPGNRNMSAPLSTLTVPSHVIQTALALGYEENLEFGQGTPQLPAEVVGTGMAGRRIGLPGMDGHLPCPGHIDSPGNRLIINRQVMMKRVVAHAIPVVIQTPSPCRYPLSSPQIPPCRRFGEGPAVRKASRPVEAPDQDTCLRFSCQFTEF